MVMLGFVWALHAHRSGRGHAAHLGALLLGASLAIAAITSSVGTTSAGFQGHQEFLRALFGYHLSLVRLRGPFDYLKILYMWSWSILWPMFMPAIASLLSSFKRRELIKQDHLDFAVMLVAVPILFLGDWGRALLLVVPFSLNVAALHPLAKDARFVWLLAIGGASTVLARPLHTPVAPPAIFTASMMGMSIASSALLIFLIARSLSNQYSANQEEFEQASARASSTH